jgi:predicted ester cyclase
MNLELNKRLVKEYYEEVVNTGDASKLDNYLSPAYTEIFGNVRYQTGIEGAKVHLAGVRENYTNLTLEITCQIAENDLVVTCYTMRGIHSGNWMGMKPTGKSIEITGVNIDRVIDGKIVEHGGAANMFEGFLAIGAISLAGDQVS